MARYVKKYSSQRKPKKPRFYPLWALFAAAVVAIGGWAVQYFQDRPADQADAPSTSLADENQTRVYFLDVGQGDSELIRLPDGVNILIDAGTNATEDELPEYLKDLGVSRIDVLIATHPHEDHIGGMDTVIRSLEIGKVCMPDLSADATPTTKTYESVLDAIAEKGLKVTRATPGAVLYENETADIRLTLLAPLENDDDNLNNYSVVAKLTCGNRSFLFTGDAEKEVEDALLASGADLSADVLKCGHHGSKTSTSADFLAAVHPGAAVISCGLDNDYGHPSDPVVKRLNKAGISIYRTDQQDTLLAQCDGDAIAFTTGLPSVLPDKYGQG